MNKDDTYILPTFKEEIGKWIKKNFMASRKMKFWRKRNAAILLSILIKDWLNDYWM